MTAVVPLLAEALNLAITEHWTELMNLERDDRYSKMSHPGPIVPMFGEWYTAGLEALAVAVHARLQEQGALT